MTESEWLTCTDPGAMLEFLRNSGWASERKRRLLGVAVCRRIWPLLTDARSRKAVEFTERYADSAIDRDDFRQAGKEAYRAWGDASFVPDDPGEPPDKVLYGSSRPWRHRPYEDDPVARQYLSPHHGIAIFHAAYAVYMLTVSAVERVVAECQEAVWFGSSQDQRSAAASEGRGQSDLLRDVFGPLPFRELNIDPAWLAWDGCTVRRLAGSAYDERAMPGGTLDRARLAVLADALEEAGCADADILGHLRGPGPCVRGCWAVDLLLGK
jgi:hypothetical protein